jgi:integrase
VREDMLVKIKTTNLQNRNGKLYFRIKVPADCRDSLSKTEIRKSLGLNKDRVAEAAVIAEDLAAEWNAEFEKLRRSSGQVAIQTPTGRHIETEVRRKLIRPNMNLQLDYLLGQGNLPRCVNELEFIQSKHDELLNLLEEDKLDKETLHNVDYADVLGAYDLKKWPHTAQLSKIRNSEHDEWHDSEDPMDHSVWTLSETLGVQNDKRALRGILRALRDELEYIAKEIINEFPKLNVLTKWDPLLKETQPASAPATPVPAAAPAPAPPSALKVKEVLDECLAAKERDPKGRDDIAKEVLNLMSWLGMKAEKTPVTDIKTSHIIDYRDNYLKHIATNINKNNDAKNKPLKAQVAYSKKNNKKILETSTINNRLKQLNIFFNYARKKHYVPHCVSESLQLQDIKKQNKLAGRGFSGFSDDQMNALMRYQESHKIKLCRKDPWKYWIPLLIAYTGCRGNEIAMLTADDIQQEDDIWFIDLHNDPSKLKKVKNTNSIRKVPICKILIDLGFIEYVNKVPKRGNKDRRLWPTLTYADKSKWLRKCSQYFNNTLRPKIGAEDIENGMHDLRSSVSRALQRQKVEQRVIDEITGHMPKEISPVSYGYQGRLELSDLLDALNKLNWEEATATDINLCAATATPP